MENALEARGSLTETRLRRLLEAAQNERATGTLTLRQDGQQATSLYFLFGHLFHAVGGGGAGDDAVVQALAWSSGEFDFDAKAKLPPDESVRASIPDLIARANSESQGQAPAGPNGGRPQAWSPPGAQPQESQPAQAAQGPQPQQQYDRRSEQPYQRPAQSHEQQRSRGPEAEPEAPPEIRRGLKFRPVPKHGREPIPVPNGDLMYDSLKTSFVDFPRLLTTLEREGYTGYVRLLADNATGLIYFREGTALEAVYDGGQDSAELGTEALGHFAQEVGRGQGVLDVVALAPDLVDGLYHVTVAQSVYTQLYAGWVDMHAFLRFLEERQLTGSLMVRSPAATGVIILDEGRLAGAYTSTARQVANSTDGVLALCEDPNAMIEVKAAADERRPPLDLSQVVGQRQGGQNFGQPSGAAPQPPPATSGGRSRQYPPASPAQRAGRRLDTCLVGHSLGGAPAGGRLLGAAPAGTRAAGGAEPPAARLCPTSCRPIHCVAPTRAGPNGHRRHFLRGSDGRFDSDDRGSTGKPLAQDQGSVGERREIALRLGNGDR